MNNADNITIIKDIVKYIEDNIKNNLSLDDISKSVYLSKYYIDRIFKSITNKSLIEYVRARKLSHSIKYLLNTDFNIVDIAYEYGFKYEQSYIRAFKNEFFISPAQYRKQKNEIKITNIIDISCMHSIANGIIIEPKHIIKPKFYIIGIRNKISNMDNWKNLTANKLGIDFFYHKKNSIPNIKNHNIYIGLSEYIKNHNNENFYTPSVEVYDLKHIPTNMIGHEIPNNNYAVFKYIGMHKPDDVTIKELKDIYEYIFSKWLLNTSYKLNNSYHFEKIDLTIAKEDYCEVDIYMPI